MEENPPQKTGSIVRVLTAISRTCCGMTRLLSQLQPMQLRENLVLLVDSVGNLLCQPACLQLGDSRS